MRESLLRKCLEVIVLHLHVRVLPIEPWMLGWNYIIFVVNLGKIDELREVTLSRCCFFRVPRRHWSGGNNLRLRCFVRGGRWGVLECGWVNGAWLRTRRRR